MSSLSSLKFDMHASPRVGVAPVGVASKTKITDHIRKIAQANKALCILVEEKEVIPIFKGTDGPTPLRLRGLGYSLSPTTGSSLFRETMMSLLGGDHYHFQIGTVLNMSSSGTGSVNSLISNSVLGSTADFVALSGVFSEFFIKKMTVSWQPVSLYNGPTGFTNTTMVSSLPLGVANLQHVQAAYTSLTSMADTPSMSYINSGKEFLHEWKNIESPSSTVADPLGSSSPTQSWSSCSNSGSYQGSIQILSQPAPPALPVTQVLGTFLVRFDVLFRNRF